MESSSTSARLTVAYGRRPTPASPGSRSSTDSPSPPSERSKSRPRIPTSSTPVPANPISAPPSAPATESTSPPTAARPGRTSVCATRARSAASSSIPTIADVVYVGALGHAYGPNNERGVFKSTDGGTTWTHVSGQRSRHRRLRSCHRGRQSQHSFRRHVERASSAMEHLRSAAGAGRWPLSLDRQRSHLDAAHRQWTSRRRVGPRRRCGRARWQARVRA